MKEYSHLVVLRDDVQQVLALKAALLSRLGQFANAEEIFVQIGSISHVSLMLLCHKLRLAMMMQDIFI